MSNEQVMLGSGVKVQHVSKLSGKAKVVYDVMKRLKVHPLTKTLLVQREKEVLR